MKQYINWTPVNRGGAKPAKVPFDPQRGEEIDPHDSANWKTFEECTATGYPVGFVLTENDPYFLLDLDDCFDAASGQWNEMAQRYAAEFAGAAIEVSTSGNGLHIMGTCDMLLTSDRRNKIGPVEFYTRKRFVALGRGFSGDINKDCTAAILRTIPQRETSDQAGIPDSGPVPEWSGPTDDNELLQLAFNARGSAAQMLGQNATLIDLWNGNADVLARFYPSASGEPFDGSAADGALVMHLGFWTGKDAARVERLWRAAPLVQGRDKMNRPDYVRRTILTGLGKVRTVYQSPAARRATQAAQAPAAMPGVGGVEYMTAADQMAHFAGCVYIDSENAALCPDGEIRSAERFRIWYGGKEFQMQADGARPTRDAWECFTQSRVVKFPKVKRRRYLVGVPYGTIIGDEINIFHHVPGERRHGDPTPFLSLLRRLLPVERDRAIVTAWLAAAVQYPGVKFQWAVVLQGAEGNGKTFILKCLEHAVGQLNTHLPNSQDLDEKYNTYLEGKLLIGVEEIHMSGRRDILDRLKPYITNSRVEIRAMRTDKRMSDNLTNWLFLTNYRDAVLKSRSDRRYAIFFTAQQDETHLARDGMDGDYFPRLWEWARNGGFEIVADYLARVAIPDEFNPATSCHRAPVTSSTHEAIAESLGPVEQVIHEAIESGLPGFRGGWCSTARAKEVVGAAGRSVSHNAVASALRALGFAPCDTWAEGRSPFPIMNEGGVRPRLYVNRTVVNRTFDDYMNAQGYVSGGSVVRRS